MTVANTEVASDRDRQYWENHARGYDASLRVLAKPLPRMLELVAAACRAAGRVLELAAGTGLVTTAIASVAEQVTATDYSSSMVDMLRTRVQAAGASNVTCAQADIFALPYPPASFDVVVAANVLHLVPDLDAAIRAMLRVLRPEGKLVVPTFCHDETILSAVVSRLLSLTGFPGHRRFTGKSLRAALEQHGMRVTGYEVIGGLIPITYAEGAIAHLS